MKTASSRRSFLQKSALATTGVALLSSPIASAFASNAPYKGYNPYVASKTDLRTSWFGHTIQLQGTILDKDNNPVKDATVEVWHLSPNSTKYKHRTKLQTNSQGEYTFKTDKPNKETGKAARIYFKVSKAHKTYFTELILGTNGAFITSKHWNENKSLGTSLLPETKQTTSQTNVNFTISL